MRCRSAMSVTAICWHCPSENDSSMAVGSHWCDRRGSSAGRPAATSMARIFFGDGSVSSRVPLEPAAGAEAIATQSPGATGLAGLRGPGRAPRRVGEIVDRVPGRVVGEHGILGLAGGGEAGDRHQGAAEVGDPVRHPADGVASGNEQRPDHQHQDDARDDVTPHPVAHRKAPPERSTRRRRAQPAARNPPAPPRDLLGRRGSGLRLCGGSVGEAVPALRAEPQLRGVDPATLRTGPRRDRLRLEDGGGRPADGGSAGRGPARSGPPSPGPTSPGGGGAPCGTISR